MLMDNKIVRVAEKYPDLAFDDASPVILDYPLFYLSANEGGQNSTNGNNIEQLLLSISLELHTVRETYYKCNPILRIQRWWRRKVSLKRNNINKTLFSSSRAPYTELIKSSYEQRDK